MADDNSTNMKFNIDELFTELVNQHLEHTAFIRVHQAMFKKLISHFVPTEEGQQNFLNELNDLVKMEREKMEKENWVRDLYESKKALEELFKNNPDITLQ